LKKIVKVIVCFILLTVFLSLASKPQDIEAKLLPSAEDSIIETVISNNNIYQKSFENDLLNVVMDTITVSKKNAKKMGWSKEYVDSIKGKTIQVEYPKIIEEQVDTTNYKDVRRFKLLDPNGKVLIEREYNYDRERWYTSENKKYIVFSKMPIEDPFNVISTYADFYNDKGKVLWRNEERGYFVRILNSGVSIGGFMGFINKKGEEIGLTPKIKPYPDICTSSGHSGHLLRCNS